MCVLSVVNYIYCVVLYCVGWWLLSVLMMCWVLIDVVLFGFGFEFGFVLCV